jgi:hypothetical protein
MGLVDSFEDGPAGMNPEVAVLRGFGASAM